MKHLLVFVIVNISFPAFSAELPTFFDESINSLRLQDVESGKNKLQGMQANCEDHLVPAYCLENMSGSQKIMLLVHPGDYKYSVSEILVEKSSPAEHPPEFPNSAGNFETSKGIKLGISQPDLIAKLGEPHQKDENTIRYRIEFDNYLLEKYNMPIYFGNYDFEDGKLIKFRYGFEYP